MIKVQGTAYGAVSYAICQDAGYTGYKRDVAHEATAHALDWWQGKELTGNFFPPDITMGKPEQKRRCKKYVKLMTKDLKPGFWSDPVGFIFWPAILSGIIDMVIKMVIEWLNSRDSSEWRGAQQ